MKKFVPVILLLLIPVLFSCAQSRKTSSKKTKSGPAITSITLMRGGCFGRCPIYDITVESNGMATYTGKMFVKDSGIYQKNIGISTAAGILKSASDYRIDTCSESYDNMIPDLPGINYEYVAGGKKKVIFNGHFGPASLKKLARMIDEEVKVDRTWKKTGEYIRPD